MAAREYLVDLRFVVLTTGLEVFNQPPQYRHPLASLHGNADQAIPGINEVVAHARVIVSGLRVRLCQMTTLLELDLEAESLEIET